MTIIDITYTLEEGMTTFTGFWHFGYEIHQLGRHQHEGRATRKISFGSHTGTHMDAPLHFIENGMTIDQIPMDIMLGPVTIYDLSHLPEDAEVTLDMLDKPVTERIIFKYGWGKNWTSKKFYVGYPYLSEEVAHHLVEKGVKIIGMDSPSPDNSRISLDNETRGTEADSPIHKILLGNNIIMVEYLANLDKLPDTKDWNWTVMPMKIGGCDGAPVRTCLHRT
mgnify:CR=1 FL=1